MFLEAIEVNEEEGKKKTNFAFLSLRADGSDAAGAPVGAAPAPAVPAGQLSKQRMLQLLDGDGLGEMTCALRTPACARSTAQAEMIYKLARCVRFFLTLDDACVRQARLGLDLLTSNFSGGRRRKRREARRGGATPPSSYGRCAAACGTRWLSPTRSSYGAATTQTSSTSY